MAFEINVNVNKNGKLQTDKRTLELSVYRESRRVKLKFNIDEEIDSEYHYLKFTHHKISYLYRVHNNEFEIPKAITAYEGRWELSFICCDSTANSDNTITSDYIYASEPITATVLKGNLGATQTSEEAVLLKGLAEGTFDRFEIPGGTTTITSYFLASGKNAFTLFIPYTVQTISDHILYESGCTKIIFEEGSQLISLADNAIYRIEHLGDITFPRSLSTWGKYNLSGCGCENVNFESTSNLKTLTSYAFWNINNLKKLRLPDRLASFSGGTSVIKGCPLLNEVWFPNTLTTVIPQNAIADCPLLSKITLQSNFNISANFSNVKTLTRETIIAMFNALKDLTGQSSKTLTLGSENLVRLEGADLDIALNKNWSVA